MVFTGALVGVGWVQARRLRETIDHARSSSERELRAYVFVRSSDFKILPENLFQVTIEIRNTGSTPAYEVELSQATSYDKFPDPMIVVPEFGKFGAKSDLGPDAYVSAEMFCQAPISSVDTGVQHTVYFYGRVRYKDAFKVARETGFRFHVTRDERPDGQIAYSSVPSHEGNYAT